MKTLLTFLFFWLAIHASGAKAQESPRVIHDRAIAILGGLLKDPYSARYSDVKVDGLFVCGRVNAKNSFGAYEGSKRFFVSEKTRLTWLEGMGQEASAAALWGICQSNGKTP